MIEVSAEVGAALEAGQAVVALESTIIAHGLPYPENLDVAHALEQAVRDADAVPATIAVIDGRCRAGLSDAELARLASPDDPFPKAGAADLAAICAAGFSAATTVSATATIASMTGIRLFATGGIGGVHRGDAADVSSDLHTLAEQPVAVVSAGAKAILDLPRTKEMLETLGVLVLGYGTDEMPAFYSRESGIRLEHRVNSAKQVAAVVRHRFDHLGQGGILIANPIPREAEIPRADMELHITRACEEARAQGIAGKRLTPFLLARVAELTSGATVAANKALALSNARLAALVAVAYADGP